MLDAKIKKALPDKSDIFNLLKNFNLATKIATLATKTKLKAKPNKVLKLQAFGLGYFRGKSHFEDDRTRSYLEFQPIYRLFKKIVNGDRIST